MDVARIRHEGLGNTTYLVEVAPGRALAVDPDRRVRRYLEAADERGWEIVAIVDTHVHADFVSGSLELGRRTGARLFLPKDAGVAFAHQGVVPGERLELGDVEIEVLATPGHTPEHLSYAMRPDDAAPPTLFSGGALIAGGAARTDLVAPELTDRLTRAQFHTIHDAFADLSDATLLMPTHGSGSFCSVVSGGDAPTTLGAERAGNPLLAMTDEEEFVAWWPTTFPATPTYFGRMRAVNVDGPRSLDDIAAPRALGPEAFDRARFGAALVVDVREPELYCAAHIQGSLSIHFRDSFATWLGWLAPADASLLFVADGVPIELVIEEALLVGYERFAGVLAGGIEAWRGAGLPLASVPMLGPDAAGRALSDGVLPLDVREPDEWAEGTIAGAVRIPLGKLDGSAGDLPGRRPVLTYCAAGERSTTAASILERHGVSPVANLEGGYGAWHRAGRD
jgi:rhodanese-related sulfurtransferase